MTYIKLTIPRNDSSETTTINKKTSPRWIIPLKNSINKN